MILVGSVEPFNELFVRSVLFGLGIKILESNYLFVMNSLRIIELSIYEMDTCRIRRISVANESICWSTEAVLMASFIAIIAGCVPLLSAT